MIKLDKVGEERLNNFGSKMIIVEYRETKDIDVYFPEYNWTAKNKQYIAFKNGNIKCPYEPRIYGHGYIGKGKYKSKENGRTSKCYRTWCDMLKRCYDEKYKKKRPTYKNIKVYEGWLDYQNFGEWFTDNYYEVEGEVMHLDKDILRKNNKIYSPENCVFVPQRINNLFPKCDNIRGNYPVGVTYNKQHKKFQSNCRIYDYEENKNKKIYLGLYDTPEEAFNVYKQFKENHIKHIANYYKDLIPQKLYEAMYKYEVEITD